MKNTRKIHPSRAGRRNKPERREAPETAVAAPFPRPANDTGVDIDFAADPALDPVFPQAGVPDLDVVAETLASVEPDLGDDSLPDALVPHAALADSETAAELPEAPEEADDAEAEEELSAESEPDEDAAPAAAGPKSDEPQSFLAMYFRDMAELSVLKPEQEFETARHIEELELDLWHSLLGYAPWAGHLVQTVETAMGSTLPDFKTFRALSERVARKSGGAEKKKLAKLFVSLSAQIKELDIDRVFVDAALTELQRLSGAARMKRPIEGLGFGTETKSFHEFAATITKKSGVVKRA